MTATKESEEIRNWKETAAKLGIENDALRTKLQDALRSLKESESAETGLRIEVKDLRAKVDYLAAVAARL